MAGRDDGTVLADVEVAPGRRADVRLADGVVVEIEPRLAADAVIDCRGGALLPGLHDHHCHLLATAAASRSVMCGPPAIRNRDELASTLRAAEPRRGWIRGVGYHEAVAGDLDRDTVDALRSDVAVRIQHRSGALWVLNSAALALVEDGSARLERDSAGQPTGRLWRSDAWLRQRIGHPDADGLGELSRRLASYGVTGVTDATPDLDADTERVIERAGLAQRVYLLGGSDPSLPRKIVVGDHQLPDLDELIGRIASTRPRRVAVHCVTRAALLLTLAALAQIGSLAGDRIEHAAVAPPEAVAAMARLGLAVVTQPSLLVRRGDDYLDSVEADDLDCLWPHGSLLTAGVPVGCSSDAPYGDLDPWAAVRAAASRRTAGGRSIGAAEAVTPLAALRGYLSDPRSPGGPPRTVNVGSVADLVVLDRPLAAALADPSSENVQATFVGGSLVFHG